MYKTIFLDLSEEEKYAKNEVHTFFWDTLYIAKLSLNFNPNPNFGWG